MFMRSKDPNTNCMVFLDDVKGIWGDRLESVVLYGSAARSDFSPSRSDLNFLIVSDDVKPETLRKVQPLTRRWRRIRIATPLFMRREVIRRSLDSYPLEFLSIMAAYRLLYGEDPLADLEFQSEYVRLQCERELKSKLLLLREAYVDSAGSRHVMRGLVSQSLPAMTAIFQGLLYLRGRDWKVWGEDLLKSGNETFNLDTGLFRELWRIKKEQGRPQTETMHKAMSRYINEIERLATWVDQGGLRNEKALS
ncbi:MAG: nucleotidyltransferase domain-containing protein [Candidatus Eisenbacteria bacterium]|uniref:Nucleotidyltransferase domain-containing protein n=1 Tax=Eiseniibacteriota bacterium TaxID=2212470 RepID=A0A948S3T6_UNCEI|nr:nucleotidyltransferase domain-containing protein [Candidatus Eisenbacteria bacterium]MBU2693304.1 nucleotidyltransferase domain-containing protein [Candidatus Eisenbacteria bacterium]